MKFLNCVVLCFLCYNFTLASELQDTYRAGIVGPNIHANPARYLPLIQEAAESKVDIVVLPSPDFTIPFDASECESDNYDEYVKILSNAAKHNNMYIVSHLYEKARCQSGTEFIRSNLVFDRQGSVIAVYRKPVNNIANCTTSTNEVGIFSTDFGVTFGLLMEEDLVLMKPEKLKSLKNFVVTGGLQSEISALNANQFASSWAFVNNAKLVCGVAIFAGNAGLKTGDVKFADLKKCSEPDDTVRPPVVTPSVRNKVNIPGEDLAHYIIRPLDLERSAFGYKEVVCHGHFCCEFFIKTTSNELKNNMSYGLAAFDGVRQFGRGHNIGIQNCAVLACAGLYKRTCTIGHETNSTNVVFERVAINGNFTSQANYPIIHTTDNSTVFNKFRFNEKVIGNSKHLVIDIEGGQNILNIGILSRNYEKDTENPFVMAKDTVSLDVYDYIFNEDVQEFFDYVWIRLRIFIVIVSIYILEMM